MPPDAATLLNQAAMEQATGLSREVLRKWELRYQFPLPVRGARGQRLYAAADVQRLQLIHRLLRQGLRAGKIVRLSLTALQALLGPEPRRFEGAQDSSQMDGAIESLLLVLQPESAPLAVRTYLEGLINAQGLAIFVDQFLPAFNLAVGDAWVSGRLSIYAEHHYTESVRAVVLGRLTPLSPSHLQPRTLLTTPPGELHSLGILALLAALTLQGADCISLGTQTPADDVVQAVRDFGVRVLAISVSVQSEPEAVLRYVFELSHRLPPDCELWLGGQGCAALTRHESASLRVFQSTGQAVQAWLKLSQATP